MEGSLERRFDQVNLCMERLSDLSSKAVEVSRTEAKDRQSPPMAAGEVVREAREVSEQARECLKRIQAEDQEYSQSAEATQEAVDARKHLFKKHAEQLLNRLVELERAQDDDVCQSSDGDNSHSGGDTPIPSSGQSSPRVPRKRDLHLPICSTASTPRLEHFPRDQISCSSLDGSSCVTITPSPSAVDTPSVKPMPKKSNVFSFKQPSSARPSMSVHFKLHDDEDWMRGGSDPTHSQNRPAESTKDANTLYGIFDELQLMVNPGLVEPLSPKAKALPFSPRTHSTSSLSCSVASGVPMIATSLAKKKKKKSQCRVM